MSKPKCQSFGVVILNLIWHLSFVPHIELIYLKYAGSR